MEPWRAETVVVAGAETGAEVTAEAGLIIKAVVDDVVLALLSELAAGKEETGILTNVPVWPLANWMSRGCPVVIMLLPGAVFNNNALAGFWEVRAVGRGEAALEVEVMSWRTGACITIAVEVGTGTGARV